MKLAFLVLSAIAVGCGSNGSIRVSLTDAPAPASVKQVINTTNEVRVHDDNEPTGAGGDSTAGADGATGTGWVILCNSQQTFDLLQLTNGQTMPLCGGQAVEVVTGNISQIRLGVTSAQLVMTDGTTQPLDVPSGGSSGLKINVGRDVQKDQTLDIKLDFDASASLQQQGNGDWKLKPVLRVLP
jgi:hypothetical protein